MTSRKRLVSSSDDEVLQGAENAGEKLKQSTKSQYASRIHILILDITKQEHINQALIKITNKLQQEGKQLVGIINNAGQKKRET